MSHDPMIGRVIEGRYRIEERLGEGGMGVVYRARHLLLETDVALKVVNPLLAATADSRERFLREARAATAVSSPRVATLREVGRFDDRLYLTMDLVQGRTLEEVIRSEGPLPAARAAGIADQILEALEAAHGKGIVHRDLKPGNVLLEEGDRVRVVDFGLAKRVGPAAGESEDSTITATGVVIGTVRYMAPEQVAGDPVDQRTDLYAVSAIIYEMLSGRRPHEAPTNAGLMRKILLEEVAPLSGALGDLAVRGLAKDPANRPESATEYRGLVAQALRGGPPVTAESPRPGRQVLLGGRLLRRRVAVGIAITAALGAGGWALYQGLATRRYERELSTARGAFEAGRWGEAARAYEEALRVRDTDEAAAGLARSRYEERREEARRAEAEGRWEDAVRAWEAALEDAESQISVEEDLRRARFGRALDAGRREIASGDPAGAREPLAEAGRLAALPSESSACRDLEAELARRATAEHEAATAADAARASGNLLAEREAWEIYRDGFPRGPRAAEGSRRLEEIRSALSSRPGLAVHTTPRGANVYLDGRKRGRGPLYFGDVGPGTHRLLVTAERRVPFEADVVVREDRATEVRVDLSPIVGSVRVATGVAGAEVLLEARDDPPRKHAAGGSGEASFERVLVGRYRVVARAAGRQEASGELEVREGEEAFLELALAVTPGTLVVKTLPAGLEVSAADRPFALSPARFEGVPSGEVAVLVRDPAGPLRLAVAEVRQGDEAILEIDLAALAALETAAYIRLVEAASRIPLEGAILAVSEALADVPGARWTAEALLARRALEALAGRIEVPPLRELELPAGEGQLFLSPSATFLCRLDRKSGRLTEWDLAGGGRVGVLETLRDFVAPEAVGWSPDERELWAEWRQEGTAYRFQCWDSADLGAIVMLEGEDAALPRLWISPERVLAVSRWWPAVVRWYDLDSGTPNDLVGIRVVADHEGAAPRFLVVDTTDDERGDDLLDVVEGAITGETCPIALHGPSARAIVRRDGDSDDSSIFEVVDLRTGGVCASFQVTRPLLATQYGDVVQFAPDGESVWISISDPEALLRVPLADPSASTEVRYDPDWQTIEIGCLSRYALVYSGPDEDGSGEITAYDLVTGLLAVTCASQMTDPVFPGRLSDADHVVLTSANQTAIIDRATGRMLSSGVYDVNDHVAWLPGVERVWARRLERDSLYEPNASEPYWYGDPMSGVDLERGIGLAGTADFGPAWIDLATGGAVVVDRAFARRAGGRPVRLGDHWLHVAGDGRLRVYRERDLVKALLPPRPPVHLAPGELLRAVEGRAP